MAEAAALDRTSVPCFTYDKDGASYRHWQVSVDGRIATVAMNVDPDGGLVPGYKLKLNSYDLGVDMELNDIVQRLRFEQPQVGCAVTPAVGTEGTAGTALTLIFGVAAETQVGDAARRVIRLWLPGASPVNEVPAW
mgnify:CR=1 FL=1